MLSKKGVLQDGERDTVRRRRCKRRDGGVAVRDRLLHRRFRKGVVEEHHRTGEPAG